MLGQLVGEVFGTFILILLGDGVVANVGLAPRLAATAYNWNTITIGWAFAVIIAVYVSAGVSGAHLNPAVTIGLAVKRGFPWGKVIPYIAAQMVGAFLGALGVYLVYMDGLKGAGMPNVWATGPGSVFGNAFWGGGSGTALGGYSFTNALIAEIVGTAVLLWGILASGDARNTGLMHNLGPFLVGGTVLAVGLSLGGPSGYAINPARDLGPRIFGALAGTSGLFADGYWWIPIVGPIVGGVIGVFTYDWFVTHIPAEKIIRSKLVPLQLEVRNEKLINKAEDVVLEELEGMSLAHPDLIKVHFDPNYIVRADAPVKGKVGVLCGGGSGHEPMHGGFVGMGMLDAACPGAVFTSPTPDQMLEATKAIDGGAGVLHIVKNYTGDVMNFEMAADLARSEGIDVEAVVIDDDVAVKDSLYTAGRRGVGATILAEKMCGAAAEQKRSLKEIVEVCNKVKDMGRTMGMALTSCTVPHVGKPTFDLPENEMEIGIGIHGEPGRTRMALKSADEIVEMLMEPIISDIPYKSGDSVLLFVNGMGGTPLVELYIVYRKAYEIATKHGLKVMRNLVGPYITSLEMAGTSITLLKLDDDMIKLWDAPVKTPALRWGV